MSTRQRAKSGSPFEDQYGFSRAIRVDDRIIVAGTGPIEDDGTTTPGGASEQAARCFELIIRAIEQLGGDAKDVVRTRMFLTDIDQQDVVGAVHARYFGEARPAATMVGVATLCRPEWIVEIEAEAIIGKP
jgi:enamine deaminase RidA (YjgF/YER057c/UK114 family)